MLFVDVAAPGGVPNPADDTGYGSVGYDYRIGQYEVTAGQYRDFLNAVDSSGTNPNGVYNSSMDSDYFGCQIGWNSETSDYDFSGRPSGVESDWTNRPVNYVSWYDAARFANFMTTGTTESGVYTFVGGSLSDIMDHQAAAAAYGTAYFIPTEDEWYKAAYYSGSGATYYDYPTGSDTAPGYINNSGDFSGGGSFSEGGIDPGNYATFDGDEGTNGIGPDYYRTNVGEHENSASPFLTYDQGGNVWEWNETPIGDSRGLRGGSFIGLELRADHRRSDIYPVIELSSFGFRVASISVVPEPGSLGLLALAGLLGLRRRRRLGR